MVGDGGLGDQVAALVQPLRARLHRNAERSKSDGYPVTGGEWVSMSADITVAVIRLEQAINAAQTALITGRPTRR